MVYVSMENQFAFLYDVLRRAMAADPDYKVMFSLVFISPRTRDMEMFGVDRGETLASLSVRCRHRPRAESGVRHPSSIVHQQPRPLSNRPGHPLHTIDHLLLHHGAADGVLQGADGQGRH